MEKLEKESGLRISRDILEKERKRIEQELEEERSK
jgi:hypothetical protein